MISVRDKEVSNSTEEWVQIAVAHEHLPLKEQNMSDHWCTLRKNTAARYEEVLNFTTRSDDVFLTGFPKSGTTWLQETVWLLMNELDFERANNVALIQRSLFLELFAMEFLGKIESLKLLENMPSPRLIKTHMPANLLPREIWAQKQKIIYVARNAKDVFTSFFHFYKGIGMFTDNVDNFVKSFVSDGIDYTPYWSHVVEYWKLRNKPHVFFVTYEEMKRDLASVIQRLCVFLERPKLAEEEMKKILEYLSFDMRKASKNNLTHDIKKTMDNIDKEFDFMRRGVVGSYKNDLSEETKNLLNDWTQASLEQFGLKEEDIFGKF